MIIERAQGTAGFNDKNSFHLVTNIGKKKCTMLLVERK